MTGVGRQILDALFSQVFKPDSLNANVLIKKSQGGSAPETIEGFSRKTVFKRKRLVDYFIKKVLAEWELLKESSEVSFSGDDVDG